MHCIALAMIQGYSMFRGFKPIGVTSATLLYSGNT